MKFNAFILWHGSLTILTNRGSITPFTILLICIAIPVYSQSLSGRYEGAVTRDGSIQLVNFDFYIENGIQKGTYEIPENGSYDVPLKDINFINDTLSFRFYFGVFHTFVDEDKKQITGMSAGWNPKIRLHVKKSPEKVKPYIKEEIIFHNGDIRLSGMLYNPNQISAAGTKYVILVHGSGAQDRYSPYYISLGYQLSKQGYGVLLYDKRGTGNSTGNWRMASMEELAGDAAAAFIYLQQRTDLNISQTGFLGTSQGGWIAPIAANNLPNCSFLILNVSPAVSVFEQDLHRITYSMAGDGWDQTVIDSASTYTRLYFQYAETNDPADWTKLQILAEDIKEKDWAYLLNFTNSEDDFIWWRKNNFDPEQTLRNLSCRTLVLFGEKDNLVPPAENERLMREYLTAAGIDFDIIIIKDAGHDMRTSQGLNGKNWDWPKVYWQWRVQPEAFLDSIIRFLKQSEI